MAEYLAIPKGGDLEEWHKYLNDFLYGEPNKTTMELSKNICGAIDAAEVRGRKCQAGSKIVYFDDRPELMTFDNNGNLFVWVFSPNGFDVKHYKSSEVPEKYKDFM